MIEKSCTVFLVMSSVKADELIAWDSCVIVLVVQLAENATGAEFIGTQRLAIGALPALGMG